MTYFRFISKNTKSPDLALFLSTFFPIDACAEAVLGRDTPSLL